MSLAIGARLGPYEIAEPLGKGGMGEVYRARDDRLRRDVAIKVLPSHAADSPDALGRFEFEARAVASLNHPNILALYDVGVEAGVSYAVTELLEGETLRERLSREGQVPPRIVLDLAIQLARGLAAAHGRGIVHRDLKPENLFLTRDGRLKILDFGLAVRDAASTATHADDTRLVTQPGILLGTVGYMAPEQVRGEPASTRSDIFSFGLVLYEVLTGSNPFKRDTMPETLTAILRDQPEPIGAMSGLPLPAARLIDRCLEKRPEDRPESMRDLSFVLEALAINSDAPTRAADTGGNFRLATWALPGASALVVLLTLVFWAYVGMSARRAADPVVTANLSRADTLVRRAQQERLERLQLHARLVASFPQLKALFETDAPTIRDYLQSYQQQNPGTPLLIALGPGAYVLARTDADASTAPGSGQEWMATLLSARGTGVISINGRPHHAAVANAEAAGTIFGSVLAAAPIDDGFAHQLREVTEAEAVLLDEGGSPGASIRSGQVPWKSLEYFRKAGGAPGTALDVTIGAAHYTAWEVSLFEGPPIAAVILASRDDVTGQYRALQDGLLVIGFVVAGLVLAAGAVALRRARRAR
jgi:hypothetical protein